MCGFVASKGVSIEYDDISYRGLSDYKGYYNKGDIYMGHYSLPFMSLDKDVAIQPFVKDNIPYMLVGEVFNYQELGNYKNDTQFLANAFGESNFNMFHKLDGFWSFVTVRNNHILAVTDYLSQKPIYYRTDMEVLASEIDTLKKYGPVTENKLFMSNVLKWGYDPRPETPWNEIKQIPPGCYYYKGQVKSYWDWDKVTANHFKNDLIKSTLNRLIGKRDIALLLSGGLDSTIIFSILKNHKQNVKLIHVENNEKKYLDKVSFYYTVKDIEIINFDEITREDSIKIHQSPVDLGSVRQQISLGKKVKDLGYYSVMSGDGADELFGGYRRSANYDSQYSDVFMELPYYHLPKLDRTLMYSTVELRSPFLSPSIVKHALQLPYEKRNGEKKLLKETFYYDVPDTIITRPKQPLKSQRIIDYEQENRIKNIEAWREMYVE